MYNYPWPLPRASQCPPQLPTHLSALACGAPGCCPLGPSPGPAASSHKDLEVKSQPLGAPWDVGRGERGRASLCSDLVSPLPVALCHRLSHQLCYIRPRGWTAGETETWTPQLRTPTQDTVSSTPILLTPTLHPLPGSAIPALP